MKRLLLIMAIPALSVSCSEDEQPKVYSNFELATADFWQPKEVLMDRGIDGTIDEKEVLEACDLDNEMTLNTDGNTLL